MERHEKLENYINKCNSRKFVWGDNDCCTFASNWVEELTGANPLEELGYYGKYTTREDAEKLLELLGGVEEIVDGKLGDSTIPAFAIAGDLVCGDLDHGETLGICLGVESAFLGTHRIITRKTLDMKKIWRV